MKQLRHWAAYLNYCLISLFIIAYFSVSSLWLWLTGPTELRTSNSCTVTLRSYLSPITSLTGLDQSWSLFSPYMRVENSYTLIVTCLQNGLLKLAELSRIEKLDLLEKLKEEKYRKLYNDNTTDPVNAFIRPDIARFIIRANNEEGNLPIRATFFLISNPIALPDHRIIIAPARAPARHQPIEKYFVYGVGPDDL